MDEIREDIELHELEVVSNELRQVLVMNIYHYLYTLIMRVMLIIVGVLHSMKVLKKTPIALKQLEVILQCHLTYKGQNHHMCSTKS